MSGSVRIPWLIGRQPYTVEVEMPGQFSASVVEIYAESGTKIPAGDWPHHGFDELTLDLCVARAITDDDTADLCEDRREL